jgi:uncharacterized protein with von Willebrand factor type A (vWA) domain
MLEELLKAVTQYKELHPEVAEIMKQFQRSQEVYEKASKAIHMPAKRRGPTYGLTTEGPYDANVSRVNRGSCSDPTTFLGPNLKALKGREDSRG